MGPSALSSANLRKNNRCSSHLGSLRAVSDTVTEIPVPVLAAVAAAAKDAVELSTGKGTESSGSGRFEWGTWIDIEKREKVREMTDDVQLRGGSEIWPKIWELVGGEQKNARVRIASGQDWDMVLHVFYSDGKPTSELGYTVQHPTGSLVFLKPLLGTTKLQKMRKDRDGNLVPMGGAGTGTAVSLEGLGFGGSATAPSQLLLGGPLQELRGTTGASAVLEVLLIPPMGLPPRDTDLVTLPFDDTLLRNAFFSFKNPPPKEDPPPKKSSSDLASASSSGAKNSALEAATKLSTNVGGLEAQLDAIVRRVLASRADPASARRLGISHVRGVLLSGPPGCGKTLLARELARELGAREPQVVNGPEILDKFVGEAERKVRALFEPAEAEWKAMGDASALHVIILDEMDAIARKRGTLTGDATGVRDSVVNQLLSKMDGVSQPENFLVVGLTNRPELLDDALLRPGRLEVHLRVSLPDAVGRREILRIHTRAMRESKALSANAAAFIDAEPTTQEERSGKGGLADCTENFSGAELAGLVRSAASFSLARAVLEGGEAEVQRADLERALQEVTPSSSERADQLSLRFQGYGVAPPSAEHERVQRELHRFIQPSLIGTPPRVRGLLLVGQGQGAGVSAIGAWAGSEAARTKAVDYARVVTCADLGGGGEAEKAGALGEVFAEARGMGRAIVVLDDVDRMMGGDGPGGVSPSMVGALSALLREPLGIRSIGRGGEGKKEDEGGQEVPRTLLVVGTVSGREGACRGLAGLFDEVLVLPAIGSEEAAKKALDNARENGALALDQAAVEQCAAAAVSGGPVGVKELLTMAERACAWAARDEGNEGSLAQRQVEGMKMYVEDRKKEKSLFEGIGMWNGAKNQFGF